VPSLIVWALGRTGPSSDEPPAAPIASTFTELPADMAGTASTKAMASGSLATVFNTASESLFRSSIRHRFAGMILLWNIFPSGPYGGRPYRRIDFFGPPKTLQLFARPEKIACNCFRVSESTGFLACTTTATARAPMTCSCGFSVCQRPRE